MYLPLQSTVTASLDMATEVPAATIFLLLIKRVAFVKVLLASFTIVAFVNAYVFCDGSAMPFTGKVV